MKFKVYFLLVLFLLTANLSLSAFELPWSKKKSDFKIILPINCSLGQDCFVLYYPDRKVDSSYKDYRCGGLSFDNNRATIFAVKPKTNPPEESVQVLAAADGKVVELVLTEPDDIFERGAPYISIKHSKGYRTKYSNLKLNSILVSKGQKIKQGDVIAYTEKGEDGIVQELHFTVFKNNRVMDPSVGSKASFDCNVVEEPIWQESLEYVPIVLVNHSFESNDVFSQNLSFKIRTWGLQPGDQEHISLAEPGGLLVNEHENTIDTAKSFYTSELSIDKGPGTKLKQGLWTADYRVMRKDKLIYQITKEFDLE